MTSDRSWVAAAGILLKIGILGALMEWVSCGRKGSLPWATGLLGKCDQHLIRCNLDSPASLEWKKDVWRLGFVC